MIKLSLFALCGLVISVTTSAQNNDSTIISKDKSASSEVSFWKKHHVKFAAVPMINYDPALGWNMAALTNAFFRVSPNDTISPLSMAGAMVGITTNETWYWAVYTKLYLDEDNYRITIGYGDASVNFQHYDEVNGAFIDFNSLNDLFFSEVQRRVYKRWYLGAKYVHRITTTTFEGLPDAETLNMSNLGLVISHDTRDFIYNPHTGDYLNFKTGHNRDAWGSDYNFNSYNFDYTKFFPLADNQTIAARATAMIATGEVPFEGQNVVGREDIRGYTDGKHRANQTYNIQGEYRWNFYKKWGMVGFAGVAVAVDSFSNKIGRAHV